MTMKIRAALFVALAWLFAAPAQAQDVAPAPAQAGTGATGTVEPAPAAEAAGAVDPALAAGMATPDAAAADTAAAAAATPAPATLNEPFRDTLLFSGVEVAAVREAAAGRRSNEAFLDAEKVELIPIDRKIKLSGIYYKDDTTWIIWLNGYKLHPRYLLKEIHRIEVKKDEVSLSWYDIGLNDVINIKLRPHQVYDIVTGILYNDTAGGTQ